MNRRTFLVSAAAAACTPLVNAQTDLPPVIRNLKPMTDGIQPITEQERHARIEKARRLMRENKLGAIFMEGGSSLFYFTGTRWNATDRTFGLVLPAAGEPAWIVPASEEAQAHSTIKMFSDIRAWKSDEDAYRLAVQVLKERGAGSGTVGIEERARFAIFDGLRKQAPSLEYASADPVSAGCRMIKSPAEIALMQRAADITIAAYKASFTLFREGVTQVEMRNYISAAYKALGVTGEASVSFGKYTAFPHGSITPQKLMEGDNILVDDGCSVDGYQSDITRALVFGKPTARQRQIWDLEHKAQNAALAAAKPGAACESVDAAARKVITDFGFGPDYKVPGLPHRTGHGIGLDIHEWTNFVRGNKTKIQPGMCFSDEPMIAIYGEFGVRLEDCLYITEDGPRTFSKQSPSIEQPFG
jgi:Xaa-Pro dipeptidase